MEHGKNKFPLTKTYLILVVLVCIAVITAIIIVNNMSPSEGESSISTTSADTSSEYTDATSTQTDTVPKTDPTPDTSYFNDNFEKERITDFSECLFIGDSRTEGLMLYSGVQGATAYTSRGLMVDTYFTSPTINSDGTKISIAEAVESNPDFSHVYIMLGINELGWAYDSVFRDGYGKVIDHLKSVMPHANITVQSIIPVTTEKSKRDSIYNNDNIAGYNSIIKELCAEKDVTYIDLIPYLCDENGALPEDAAFDGIHLKMPYCQKWLDCLSENREKSAE